MTLIPPVATPAAPQADTPTLNASLTPQHQTFEYAMEVQQGALLDNGRMANPATMVSEMLNSLRGYVERAQRMSKRVEQAEGHSQGKVRTADASNGGLFGLTSYNGSAQDSLGSIGGDIGRSASDSVSREIEFATQISDELFDSSIFLIQSQLIGRAIGEISKSTKTLTSGQ
jgi:hypothetical protein